MNGSGSGGGMGSRLAGRAVWLLVVLLAVGALALALGPFAFPPDGGQTARAAAVLDPAALRLLDDRTRVTLSSFRYNRATQTYLGTATVANTAPERLDAPLYLVVAAVNPTGASMVGATGLTTAGQPYYDLTALLPGGALAAGATSNPLALQMKNPSGAAIQLTLHVYGPAAADQAPVADAGPDQTAGVGDRVILDGSASHDPDGDRLTFAWAFAARPADSAATLSDPTAVDPRFDLDRPGDYDIDLVVHDGNQASAPDRVRISTANSAPVADAGPDQTATVGAAVALDGSRSHDVDGDRLSYRWTLTGPADSTATLDDPTAVLPRFTVDRPGEYVGQLVVDDGRGDSDPDHVTVTTENTRPVADAGPDRAATVGATVTLDGSRSHDVDGDPLAYRWSLASSPPGSAATLADPTTATPSVPIDRPGLYVAQLIVRDGRGDSDPDSAVVTTENARPLACPGPDRDGFTGDEVLLDGRCSRDPDGDPLQFQWALLHAPAGSTAALDDVDRDVASLVPDRPGLYLVQLVVGDGELASAPATARVQVAAGQHPPTITSTPRTTATATQLYTYDVEATDPDAGEVLTYALVASPPGMTLDPASGLVAWTPAQAGGANVKVRVTDPGGLFAEQSFTITVAAAPPPANHAPTITSTPVTTATAGQPYTYDVDATDPDAGDVLTYSLPTAPQGMTIEAASGLIQWTPTAAQVGAQPVTVRVTDAGGLSVEQSFSVTVGAGSPTNQPPTLSAVGIAPQWTQLAPTGTSLVPRYAGSLQTYDEINDRLIVFGGQDASTTQLNDVWVLSHASGLAGTPAWTKLEPTGTAPSPRSHFASAYDATANRMIVYGGCSGICSPLSDAWVLTHANGLGGQPEWLRLPASNALAYVVGGYDPISNRLVVFGGSTGARGSDTTDVKVLVDANGIGAPRWEALSPEGARPPVRGHSQPGVYDPLSNTLIVFGGHPTTGGIYNYNDVWVLSHANGLGGVPTWNQLSPTGLAPIPRAHHTMTYDPNSNRLIVFGGYDGVLDSRLNDTWVLTHANGQGGPSEWIKLTSGATPAVASTPTAGYAKSSNRLIVALGISMAETVLNDVWLLSNASGLCTANQPCTFKATASDPDAGDALTYALDAAPTGMTIDAASGAMVWTPAIAQIGDHPVMVRVTDRGGLTATQSFTATVAPVAVPNVVGLAPEWAESFISAADLAAGTKTSQGGAITLNFDSLPSRQGWVYDFFGNSVPEQGIFSVDGGTLFQNSLNAGFAYQGCNRYCSTPNIVDRRLPLQIAVRARVLEENGDVANNSFGYYFGVDTGSETFGHALGTSQIQDMRGPLVAAVPFNNTLFHDYWLQARPGIGYELAIDGNLVTSGPSFRRVNINYICSGDGTGGTNARAETTAFSFTQPRVVGQNPPPGTLTQNQTAVDLTIVDGPATETVPNLTGLTQTQAGAAILAANLTVGVVSSAPSATVPAGQVSDQSPLPDIHVPKNTPVNIVMSTGPPNRAPTITSAPVLSATAGQPYAYDVDATDPDAGDVLTYSLPTAPAGMTINLTSGLIEWTPTAAQVGNPAITVRVTDSGGHFAEQTFTVTVSAAPPVNRPPVAVDDAFEVQQELAGSGRVVDLAFDRLPSAQGWTFQTNNAGQGVTEGRIYSLCTPDGIPALCMDSTKIPYNDNDGSAFWYIRRDADLSQPFTIMLRARMLEERFEGHPSGWGAFGLYAGAAGTSQVFAFGIGIDPPRVQTYANNAAEVPVSFDPTQWHDYRLEVTPGVGFQLFVDAQTTPLASGPGVPDTSGPYLYLGDGTSFIAVRAEISRYTFISQPTRAARGNVLANDSDPDGDTLTARLATPPNHGTALLQPPGELLYVPAPDFVGTDTLQYWANDGQADSNLATVRIDVVSQNHPPLITSSAPTAAVAGQAYSYGVTAADPDVGDVLNFSLPTAPAGMTINPTSGLIAWTPTAAQAGAQPVTVRVADPGGLFAEQGFTVTVARDNHAPVAVDDAYSMQQGETLVIAGLAPVAPTVAVQNAPEPARVTRAARSYGRLPLAFEANAGQTDPRVRFLSRGQGYTLFLTPDEAVLALSPQKSRLGKSEALPDELPPRPLEEGRGEGNSPVASTELEEETHPHVLRLKLLGANPAPQASGLDALPGKSNYFIGNDPSGWRTGVPTYAKVSFDQVYPGIDLVYYGNQRQLEYDFVVAPGADPGQIRLAVEGADRVAIDAAGNLVLGTPNGEIRQHKPVVYQEIDGQRRSLDGRYVLLSPATVGWAPPTAEPAPDATVGDAHGESDSSAVRPLEVAYVGFEVAGYDHQEPLVIDPVLAYSTYLGGGSDDALDHGNRIAVDGDGDAYVTGRTVSADFPIKNAVQTNLAGNYDVFVAKLNPAGDQLEFATFLGGTGNEDGYAIAVDGSRNVFIAGRIEGSSNFPTTSGALPGSYGGRDGFFAKLNPSGDQLLYSTYLGGSGDDGATAITVSTEGKAYITGFTTSANFPTLNALQVNPGGGYDAFVAVFNPTGGLISSTYFGGSGLDDGTAIALDPVGEVYLAGDTESGNFPTLQAVQPAYGGGRDAYVTKFDAAISALRYSTYLGGSAPEQAFGVAVNNAGSAYVTGFTGSTNYPTLQPLQSTLRGDQDAFVTKLTPSGDALVYSTYLGGRAGDEAWGIALDHRDNAYVVGETSSDDFPTARSLQAFGGQKDAFLARLDASGNTLVFSTYLGGTRSEIGRQVVLDRCRDAYLAGTTASLDFPTLGAFQSIYGGGTNDAFVTKVLFEDVTDLAIAKTDAPDPVIAGNALRYTLTVSNLCNKAATGVTLSDTLPPQITLVSATPTQGTCAEAAGTVTCNLGGLAGLASAEVTLVATVNAGQTGVLTNQARVSADQDDPDPRNNSATATTHADALGGVLANDYDPDGDPITAIQVAAPAHGAVTLNPNGTFSYTPAANFSGTDTFTYQANDGRLDSNLATVTITVQAVNHPPVITSAPVTAATAGQPYAYDANAIDPDTGDTLAFSLSTAPAGMAINATSGLIAWTPTAAQAGAHPVTVRVTDPGGLFAEQTFSITVSQENVCIQWLVSAGGNGHCYELVKKPLFWDQAKADAESRMYGGVRGHLASITSAAENSFITSTFAPLMADGPVYLVWLGGYQPPGSAEPAGGWSWVSGEPWIYSNWASPEPDNCKSSCRPENQLVIILGNGSYTIGQWGDVDGVDPTDPNSHQAYYIVEYELNRQPVITSTPVTTATATKPYAYDANAIDPDAGDALTFSLPAAPAGMTIDATSGLIAWTPTAAQVGTQPVTVRVTDPGGLFAEQTFSITVLQENVCIQWDVAAGGNGHCYELVKEPLFWDQAKADAESRMYRGVHGYLASVTSAAENSFITSTFAPLAADGPTYIVWLGGYQPPGSAEPAGGWSWVSGEPWIYSNWGSPGGSPEPNNCWPSGCRPENQLAIVLGNDSPYDTIGQWGDADGVDPTDPNSHQAYYIVEYEFNRQLVITSTPVTTATATKPYAYDVDATDPDGDALTFSLTAAPAGMRIDAANGLIQWTPTEAQVGPHAVIVRVTDAGGLFAEQSFTVTVAPAQRPPAFTSTPVTTATVGQPYSYDADATDPDAGDTLSFSLLTAPAGMMIDATSGLIAWTPTAAQVGDRAVTVRVTDPGGLFVEQTFTITVTTPSPTNRPPVITSTPVTAAAAGQPYAYDVDATDPDAGDTLTFSLPTAPAGMTIDATSGLIAWTPTAAQVGTQPVTVRVTDAGGLFAEQTFTVTVSAAANQAPSITSTPVATATVGQLYAYDADATDPDGDPLTYSLPTAPTGMTVAATTGLIQWTPTAAQTGPHPVTVRVEDGRGGFATQSFTVTVAGGGPNAAPAITSTPPTGATVGLLYTYAVQATDPDGDPLTYSLTTSPTGMTVDAATGLVQWTPTAAQTGDHPVALTVADGRGGVASQSYTLRVPAVPGTIPVPDVIGATPVAADATLADAGLRAGAVTTVDPHIELGFTDLPSAQDWLYGAFGNAAPETQVFTLADGVLRQNTLGLSVTQGLNLYQRADGVHPSLPFVLTVTARVLQQEGDPTDAFGFAFGFVWGTEQVAIGLRTTGMYDATGAALSTAIDTTQFHAYRLEGARGGGYRLFVDGILVGTGATTPGGGGAPFLFIGDASHTANARGEIAAFAFAQGQGLVVDQQPAAGVLVAADSPVALTVGQAPPPVAVPDVVGRPQAAAQTTLLAAPLLVGAIGTAPSATVPVGNVVGQTPAAGATVPGFTAVDLVISTGSGQVTVPNVVGLAQAAATTALQQAGLTLGTVTTQSSATVPAGRVIGQTPAAGAQVTPGAAVNLVVSSGAGGPPPDLVPGLATILVRPASATILTGQTQSFSATGILTSGAGLSLAGKVVWASTNPAVATIDAAGTATALTPGVTTIRATNGAITGSATLTVEAGVPNATPPTAEITAPADQATVTGPMPVTGTATDPEFLKYRLEIALVGTSDFTALAEGTAPVSNGTLGTLDPTLLINDLYILRLTVYDRGGNVAQTELQVQLAREQKVGHFTLAFQDLSVPMVCMPLTVTRVYDSRETRRGDFGVGWRLDVQTLRLRETGTMGQGWAIDLVNQSGFGVPIPTYTLYDTAAHKVSLTLPDGHVEEFDLTPSPSSSQFNPIGPVSLVYTPRPGTLGSLAPVVAGEFAPSADTGAVELIDSDATILDPRAYRYTTPEGNVYLIDKFDGVQQVQCTNGQTLSFTPGGIDHSDGKGAAFTRDAEGRITTLTDPAGNVQRYAYDANGDLASHTDAEGQVTAMKYDHRHRLLEVIDPRGVRAVRNEYDADGRLASTTDPLGQAVTFNHDLVARTETVTDRLGHATVYEYDDRGNVLRQTDPLGGITTRTYDAFGNELTRTDPLGRVTTLTYDSRRNPLTETNPLGHVTAYSYTALNAVRAVTDPLGRVTTNSYDANGNLTSTADPAGGTTSYAYDARGLQTSRTDPLGQITRYAYNSVGNLIQETDPLGHVSTYSYDANGNRLSETRTVGGETRVTTFEYDGNNRLVRTTHPDGAVTRTEYNAIGKPARTVDALGRSTSTEYDAAGRLTRTVYPDGSSETSTYDAEGRRSASTDRAGRSTSYGYDALGRLVSTTFPDGASTATTYDAAGQVTASTDALGNTTAYQYDAAGRRTRVTDALGHITTFGYDAAGNQTAVTDANGRATSFTYDANNRRTRTSYPDGTSDQVGYDALGRQVGKTDQAGVVTQYGYDALGRLTRVTDALGQMTTYGYDEQGNQIEQTDANGHATTFGYDAMGRRTRRTLPLGMTETMSYDLAGNLTSKTDFNGRTTTYGYDAVNRLVEKRPDPATGEPTVRFTYTASGQRASMSDASGATTYAYDDRDRLTQKATPQGTLSYAYDAAGNLRSIQSDHAGGAAMTYAYDALNRLESVTDAHGATTYVYDAVGNLASYAYPNGVEHRYTYNPLNRLTDLTVARGATALARYAYTLGPAGNRLSVAELGGRTASYSYDALYRLTGETVSGDPGGVNGSIGYVYDSVGNRLTRSSTVAPIPAQTFGYDANDRITTEGYDDNGNTLHTDGRNFGYDTDNRLTTADGGVSFVYDGDGNRVVRTAGGVTTQFLVDTRNPTGYSQVLEEIENGAVVRKYTYGLDLVSQTQSTGVSYYGYDGHGSVRLLADAAGAVTDSYAYDAFGNLAAKTGVTGNVYLYGGERFVADINLIALRRRFLNGVNGRFLTVDDSNGFVWEPSTLHDYLYAVNDPENRVDPSGRLSIGQRMYYGTKVHQWLGVDFVGASPWRRANYYTIASILGIPPETCRPEEWVCKEMPDLVDTISREVYEIKSKGQGWTLAFLELSQYVGALNLNDPSLLPSQYWVYGAAYDPPLELVLDEFVTAFIDDPVSGIILYELNDTSGKVKEKASEKVRQGLKDSMRNLQLLPALVPPLPIF